MRIRLLYFVFLVIALVLNACGPAAQLKKADKRFESGQYYSAAEKYKRVYSKTPGKEKQTRARIAFHMGECYRILNQPNAEQSYYNAINNGYADSIVYLRYAQVLQRNGNYREAAKNFSIYLKNVQNHTMAKNGLDVAQFAEKMKKQPTLYVVKLVEEFNYRRSLTFAPSYQSADGDVLYFSSNRNLAKKNKTKNSTITGMGLNALYMARKNAAGKWEKPQPFQSEGTQKLVDDGVCSFTSDGNTMYFTRSRMDESSGAGAEIYVSKRAGGAWSDAKKVSLFKDSTLSVGHPAISPDGNTLVFVSDAPNGFGGKDLWEAKLIDAEFVGIRNLGAEINTEGDEMFPSFRQDGTLYFASNGWPGLGGLDIYRAVQQSNNAGWQVENMGIPVNSSSDDFGIAFEGKAERGFFTSNRGEFRGHDMIYSFELPVYEYILEGKITDESQQPLSDAVVKLVSNSGINTKVQTRKDGTYRIKIDKDIECVLLATSRGFLNKTAQLSTKGAKQSKVYKQDFSLQTIFKPIQLENIFYEFGKWNLTPASEDGLKVLVKILTDNPNITIEISAHTDHVGNNESNKELSAKRAQSVVDYLIASGIKSDRLSSVGLGEESPVIVNATMALKYNFLKENDVLTEEYIKKLLPEQQETANQINRRTEFRVLKTTYK